jgi:hypothetical protein
MVKENFDIRPLQQPGHFETVANLTSGTFIVGPQL